MRRPGPLWAIGPKEKKDKTSFSINMPTWTAQITNPSYRGARPTFNRLNQWHSNTIYLHSMNALKLSVAIPNKRNFMFGLLDNNGSL